MSGTEARGRLWRKISDNAISRSGKLSDLCAYDVDTEVVELNEDDILFFCEVVLSLSRTGDGVSLLKTQLQLIANGIHSLF